MVAEKVKFKPLQYYQETNKTYQLLPFRFIKLDEERYVLTNLVGEYIVLGRNDLYAFVNKNISTTSEIYNDLKSEHFLYDKESDVAVSLLVLKTRTKKNNLSNFTSLHIFVVSLRCDHSCPYCQVSRQNIKSSCYDMTQEIADKAISFMFRSPSENLKVEFQGGEPLLNFELIKYIVQTVKNKNQVENKNIQFVIATNLAFINDEILQFCYEHGILISTSLDGPADLHNKNRPRPGKNSYKMTVNGVNKIKEVLGPDSVSALMTTTKASLPRVKEIIDEYISHNFNSIFLRPLSPYGFAIKTNNYNKYDTDSWVKFYIEGLEYIIDINKTGYFFVEQYAAIILNKMFSPNEPGYVDLQSPAGIGISAIVFNYNGEVYASDEARMLAEMGDKTFKLGNLLDNSYEEIIGSDILLDVLEQTMTESMPGCADCGLQPYCGSDPVFHHATQGDIIGNKANSLFCHKNMEILRYLITLLEDRKDARNVLMSWVRY
ncbi:MAG: His-Xaa-Ser system radical SAM maturase HxsB [Coxiellaceae bacterium]|nr:MAG: His-Xaa-Ser system radical SAM maturase HxsB [Coxiellaceae bacterium]